MQNTNLPWAIAVCIAVLAGVAVVLAWQQVRRLQKAAQRTELDPSVLQSALEVAQAGSWRIDLTASAPCLELSDRAQRIYGCAAQDAWPATRWLAHLAPGVQDPATAANLQEHLQHMQRRKAPAYDASYPFQRPSDGRQLWLRDYGQLRRDAAGRPVELLGLVVDVTATKRLQDELYRSTSSLQQTMEITESGTWRADYGHDRQSMYLSDQAHAILGLTPAPDRRYSLQEMRHNRAAAGYPECVAESLRQYEAVHSGASDVINIVSAWRRPDNGALIWTHTTGKVRRDPQGQLIDMVGVMRDVTQEKEYELHLLHAKEAAESAVRTQSDFLANMSHEMLTPLNAILGLSGLALKGATEPRHQDYLKKIESSGQQLLDLLNNILDFSTLEVGKPTLESTPFNVSALMETVCQAVREKAERKGLTLAYHLEPTMPQTLLGDPLRLGQILIHFANNAVKFTQAGAIQINVTVRAATASYWDVRFAVSDTGIGLKPEQISRLFQSFTQVDTSITRAYGGGGLGLAICKKLAQAMGGEVGVQSAYGGGSTFHFDVRLQAASRDATAPHVKQVDLAAESESLQDESQMGNTPARLADADLDAPTMANRLRPLWGARLLLVEDNEINQQVACELLRDAGFAVEVADNGQLGVDRVDARQAQGLPFDLVLMDVQMPVMDGITATYLLRSRYSAQDLPIVAMTANASAADRARCQGAGMNDFVAKPVAPAQLWRALLACIPARAGLGSTPPTEPFPLSRAGEEADLLLPTLRQIAGLDVERGLVCTNRKAALYVSMLRKFVASQAKAMAGIRLALHANDAAKAERMAHTLKGLAGTLGAVALQSSALTLENAVRQQPTTPATQTAMADTEAMLEQLISALLSVPGLIANAAPDLPALSAEQRQAARLTLEHIRQLLHQSNASALDVWQNHASTLRALLNNAAEIEAAINDFDFEIALQLIEHKALENA